ncbi:MAG TPA: hypothetical protein VFJ65_04875 [Solirubrobacterales bacterium]|nr:hypothetical protein [Solirubrobacterales bacterium]
MEALKMTNWNDDRLDKRDEEVKEGFARLEAQIREGVAESDKRFARLEGQIMANRREATEGLAGVRSEMNQGFAELRSEMNLGFAQMHSAYATLTRTLLVGAIGIIAALIGVAGALLT